MKRAKRAVIELLPEGGHMIRPRDRWPDEDDDTAALQDAMDIAAWLAWRLPPAMT